jgi:hypothetical protein
MDALRSEIRALGPLVAAAALLLSTGCETGFGDPCDLPKSDEIQAACNPVETDDGDGEEGLEQESASSCAINDFPQCTTRVCLVYRGSSSFCSEPCTTDGGCEGSAKCRPLLGDLAPNICQQTQCELQECYCVKAGMATDTTPQVSCAAAPAGGDQGGGDQGGGDQGAGDMSGAGDMGDTEM